MFHKNKSKKLAVSLAILVLLFISFSFVSAQFTPEVKYPEIGTKTITRATELEGYIEYIFSLAIILGVLIAVGSLIYGGFLYLSSTGAPEQMGAAKTRILSALLGLVILLGSYLILNTVNPELLTIKIDKFEVQRGVRLIDSNVSGKKEITEINISNIQEKYGDNFKPKEFEIFGGAVRELKINAFEKPNYTGADTGWIETGGVQDAPWPIKSLLVRGIGSGIYLYGAPQDNQEFYLNRGQEDFTKIDNFNDKAEKIEIKNLIVDGEKQTDFAALLFTDTYFDNELRIFIEKRDRDGDGVIEDNEGNVPEDIIPPNEPDGKEGFIESWAPIPSSYPDNDYDGWGKVIGVSSAHIFQIGPEENCKKVTLYKNPNFYDDTDDDNDVCVFELKPDRQNPETSKLPIYKPVALLDAKPKACGDDWSDKAMSIEIDGKCLVILFEHDDRAQYKMATGKHSEVFAFNDPDLSDNRINKCLGSSGVFQWGYQPCASAIAIFPLR